MEAVDGNLRSPVDWFKLAIAPLLLKKICRIWIATFFFVSLIIACYCTLCLEFGFNQVMAFSEVCIFIFSHLNGSFQTSYLTKHFQNMNENLNIGPPLWFVVEGDVKWHDPKMQVRCFFSEFL